MQRTHRDNLLPILLVETLHFPQSNLSPSIDSRAHKITPYLVKRIGVDRKCKSSEYKHRDNPNEEEEMESHYMRERLAILLDLLAKRPPTSKRAKWLWWQSSDSIALGLLCYLGSVLLLCYEKA